MDMFCGQQEEEYNVAHEVVQFDHCEPAKFAFPLQGRNLLLNQAMGFIMSIGISCR